MRVLSLGMLSILTFLGCIGTSVYAEELGGNIAIGITHGGSKYWFHGYYKSYVIELPNQEAFLAADKRAEYKYGHEKPSPLTEFRYSNIFGRDNTLAGQNNWLVTECGSGERWPYPRLFFNKDASSVACLSSDKNENSKTLSLFETKQRSMKWRITFTDPVEDISWSPTGRYLAVLFRTTRVGLWPHELLLWLFGHPVPYNSFHIAVIDLGGNRVIDNIKVASGLIGGAGVVVWFDKTDKSLIGK